MWVASTALGGGQGHRFYEQLNRLLSEADFDRRVEELCAPYFDADGNAGRRSIAPGVYFRMLFVGYFEGIESERGLEWRCSDSLSLRTFLGVQPGERVPDHSTLSRMRTRLDGKVYDAVFRLVLGVVEAKGLLRGKVVGVDSTYLRADASMKSIVRKDTGDDYAAYLKKLCEEQGMEKPTVEDARRMDRGRKGKKVSNQDWASATDADARIVRLKDGRTRLGYKAEHVVDLESGAVVAAEVYGADQADTATVQPSLESARTNIAEARVASGSDDSNGEDSNGDDSNSDDDDAGPPTATSAHAARPTMEVVADKGYHKVALLLELAQAAYRTYVSVPNQKGTRSFVDKGGRRAREAFHKNRARVARAKSKKWHRLRGERIERTFALACETGAHRRVRLRDRENVRKRYLIHIAALNLGLVMRTAFGYGTPRQAAAARARAFLVIVLHGLVHALVHIRAILFGTVLTHVTAHHLRAPAAARSRRPRSSTG